MAKSWAKGRPSPHRGKKFADICGYVKGEPRLSLVAKFPENLPKIVVKGSSRSKRVVMSPRGFRELRGGLQPSLPGVKRDRMPPAVALEADSLVMACMMRHTDIITQRVGTPYRDSRWVHGLGHARIAEETGLNVSRVGRSLRRCVARGWLTVKHGREAYTPKKQPERCKCCPGGAHYWGKVRYCSYNATYRVDNRYIRGLGADFYEKWGNEQKRRTRIAGERRRVAALSDLQVIQFEKRRQAMAAKSAEFVAGFEASKVEQIDRVKRAALARHMRDLQLEHPDWGLERVRAEALRRL